jgi:acyl carrier protein
MSEVNNILSKLEPIFRDVFDDEEIVLTPEVNAESIDEWDSLNHIRLIVEIERCFDMRFSADEISQLENVGEMAELIHIKEI